MSESDLLVKPPGTAATQATAVQGVPGGVPVPISGSFSVSATTTAKATAAPPSYVEGVDSPISQDLTGNLRTLATATTVAKATAAVPSYTEGTNNPISQDLSGHLRVVADALPLPTGASTEATLALIKAKTDNLDVLLSTRTKPADTQKVDGSAVTQPVSATSLPLPAGAATAAKQDTGNTSLASIDGKLANPLPVTGPLTDTQLRATAVPVTANQGTAAAGASAWPVKITDTSDVVVKPGDATNNAVRVNVVAASGSTTFFGIRESSIADGASPTLTLGHTPIDEPLVIVGHLPYTLNVDYTRAGAVITWITVPPALDTIEVRYTWSLASATLSSTLVVDMSGHVQPTGDDASRSIHVTVDAATALPLPSGAAKDSSLSTLIDTDQIIQRLMYAQLAQQRAALLLQATVAGQAMFLPEVPAFLGVA